MKRPDHNTTPNSDFFPNPSMTPKEKRREYITDVINGECSPEGDQVRTMVRCVW